MRLGFFVAGATALGFRIFEGTMDMVAYALNSAGRRDDWGLMDSGCVARARVVDVLPIERSGIGRAAEALPEWLYRWVVRRQLHRTLDTRPDRLLADVGFDRERLDEQIAAVANALVERRRNRLRIQRELMAYSDRELADVGVSRSDIPAIARGEIPASIALMAANPDTAAAPTPAPANDGVRTAAA